VSILGTRVLRTEDPRFLTTGGVYTDDVADERLAGACHVHFVRSAVAHARIASVDVSGALQAPGVLAAFTGADLDLDELSPPMRGVINAQMSQPLLARDVVRYVGEPVAVVVTERRYQGEDAADLVDVDYDLLPAVIEPAEADTPGSAVLFPAVGGNVAATFGDPAALKADLFSGCEVVVSRTIVNQRVAPAPMETRAAAAVWDGDGRLTAWIPNQGAQGTRGALAAMLGIDRAAVRIITPDVGGAFGAKFGATEVPSFELAEMETPTSYNPLGAKGIGEAGTIGSTPAVQNAIIDALAPWASGTSTCPRPRSGSGKPCGRPPRRDRYSGASCAGFLNHHRRI